MAFSHTKRLALTDAGLIFFYEKHQKVWKAMAIAADEAVCGYMVGESPLPDDVVEVLLPALKVREEFRACISKTRVRSDAYYRHAADYILHMEWDNIEDARRARK